MTDKDDFKDLMNESIRRYEERQKKKKKKADDPYIIDGFHSRIYKQKGRK